MAQCNRFIARGNRSVRSFPDRTEYVLHRTPVVTIYRDGRVTLNSGGWQTNTTKLAMNQVANQECAGAFHVYQKNHEWFVTVHGETHSFTDGFSFNRNGGNDE